MFRWGPAPQLAYNCYRGVVRNGLFSEETEYSNYLFFEVTTRFDNLLPEQNPSNYSAKQLETYRLIKPLHDNGTEDGVDGDKRCNYSVNIDKDGFVESIVIMTERNCEVVLNWLLEIVNIVGWKDN